MVVNKYIGILVVVLMSIPLIMTIYFHTKYFRKKRAIKLLNSPVIAKLKTLGFEQLSIESKIAFSGTYKGYYFLVFIESDDRHFDYGFSLVFVVSYKKLSDKMYYYLNKRYYSRLKSVINYEYVFFYKDYAQFRYSNNPFWIRKNRFENRLSYIVKIMKEESIRTVEFNNLNQAII